MWLHSIPKHYSLSLHIIVFYPQMTFLKRTWTYLHIQHKKGYEKIKIQIAYKKYTVSTIMCFLNIGIQSETSFFVICMEWVFFCNEVWIQCIKFAWENSWQTRYTTWCNKNLLFLIFLIFLISLIFVAMT